MITESKVYRSPVYQLRCAQEAMIGQCISYLTDPETSLVEYINFYRGPLWTEVDPEYKRFPTPYYIGQSQKAAKKLIWC